MNEKYLCDIWESIQHVFSYPGDVASKNVNNPWKAVGKRSKDNNDDDEYDDDHDT